MHKREIGEGGEFTRERLLGVVCWVVGVKDELGLFWRYFYHLSLYFHLMCVTCSYSRISFSGSVKPYVNRKQCRVCLIVKKSAHVT